jgi:hypothetical protein
MIDGKIKYIAPNGSSKEGNYCCFADVEPGKVYVTYISVDGQVVFR